MHRVALHIVLYTACLLSFISCDIFEPRTPEEPTAARGNFIPPTEPEIVIDNFVNAIDERNSQHYIQCFIDPLTSEKQFKFIPTQSALSQFGVFDGWTVQDERNYFENLISNIPENAAFNLNLFDGGFEGQTSNEATYTAAYRLTAEHTNDGYPHFIFEGTLRFEMITDQSNNWVIHTWADLSDDETRSWSELKGRFKL